MDATWNTVVIALVIATVLLASAVLYWAVRAAGSTTAQVIEYQTAAAIQRERDALRAEYALQAQLAHSIWNDRTEVDAETTQPGFVTPPAPPIWQPERFHDGETDPAWDPDSIEDDVTVRMSPAEAREVWAEAIIVNDDLDEAQPVRARYPGEYSRRPLPIARKPRR